jgi:hypothetical protein
MGLWRRYINITISILDIIHRPAFYLKHKVLETGFCLRIPVEPTQLGPIDRVGLSPDTDTMFETRMVKHRTHKKIEFFSASLTMDIKLL